MLLPPQKLSDADRFHRNEVTGKNNIEETIDYYISTCNWNTYTTEIFNLYKAIEGIINDDDYKIVKNPFNQRTKTDVPIYNAVLKNFNILKGIANLLMGEYGKRVHDYNVLSINPNDEYSYKDGLSLLLKDYYSQAVANSLANLGFNVGQQTKELPNLDEYVQKYQTTFNEQAIISGQEILDYIKFNCDLDSKYLDAYWDWIVTGGFVTYKTVNHDDVVFEVVPRHEVFIPFEKHSRFIEDYTYIVRRRVLPAFKITDFFKGRIPEELVDKLEKAVLNGLATQFSTTMLTGRGGSIQLPTLYVNAHNYFSTRTDFNGVELFHVVYSSWKLYYELEYVTPLGTIATMEVGEDYKLNKEQGDIKLTPGWKRKLYEGYKCLDVYLDCGELKENRADLNNDSIQKLPYNGITERSSTGEIQSIIKDGLPYQRSVNVLHYNLEKLINKNKDKILVMPYGLVPRKKGMTTKDQMYHADATSVLWIDETAPNASFAAQMIKSVDMSLGNYIKDTFNFINGIKLAYWESIGMNAQRYADISDNAGKSVTEQAIVRSSTITYELVRQFDKVVEKDYLGLLDISKLAYINGKKAKYTRTDGSLAYLNLNADDAAHHASSSYAVFVKDAAMQTEAINAMRGQALNLIQNGGDTAILGHLWSTNNVTKLTKILEKLDANNKQFQSIMQKQKDDAMLALKQEENANAEAERENKRYIADRGYEAAVDSASIRSSNNGRNDNEPRPANDVERMLADHKIANDNEKLALEDKKLKETKNNNNNK